MKTLRFILTIFLLINILVGCEEIDPITPDPIVPTVVSGKINVSPTSIKAGETVTISWSDLVNVKTLMINNTLISISDGSKIYTPTTTTTFSINLIGTNDKVVEKSAVVNVAPIPAPTKLDTLMSLICHTWQPFESRYYTLDGKLSSFVRFTAPVINTIYTYNPDGSVKVDNSLNGGGIKVKLDCFGFTQNLTRLRWEKVEEEYILNDSTLITITNDNLRDGINGGIGTPIKTHFVYKKVK